jgi:hypothetical protein
MTALRISKYSAVSFCKDNCREDKRGGKKISIQYSSPEESIE